MVLLEEEPQGPSAGDESGERLQLGGGGGGMGRCGSPCPASFPSAPTSTGPLSLIPPSLMMLLTQRPEVSWSPVEVWNPKSRLGFASVAAQALGGSWGLG